MRLIIKWLFFIFLIYILLLMLLLLVGSQFNIVLEFEDMGVCSVDSMLSIFDYHSNVFQCHFDYLQRLNQSPQYFDFVSSIEDSSLTHGHQPVQFVCSIVLLFLQFQSQISDRNLWHFDYSLERVWKRE